MSLLSRLRALLRGKPWYKLSELCDLSRDDIDPWWPEVKAMLPDCAGDLPPEWDPYIVRDPRTRTEERAAMPEPHRIHKEYAEALERGGPARIEVGNTVLCDIDDTDLTEDHRSGGFMFGSYAVGPCCAERYEASIRGYGEEHMIRARCPEGVSFADWVRGMRGPGAAITITPGLPGTWRP